MGENSPFLTYETLFRNLQDDRLDSPLHNLTESQLMAKAREFYTDEDLHRVLECKLLMRGALLAQNPRNLPGQSTRSYTSIEDVDDDSYVALNVPSRSHRDSFQSVKSITRRPVPSVREVRHSFSNDILTLDAKKMSQEEEAALDRENCGQLNSLTKGAVILIMTCAAAALAQGWSQQNIVGANLNWPVALKIANEVDGRIVWSVFNPEKQPDRGLAYFSLVNAIPYFAASLIGAWVSDPVTYVLGRRAALFFAGLCSVCGAIGSYYARSWQELFLFRLITGIGMGSKSSVVPVLLSECVGKELRGKILVSWQTFVAAGILCGAISNLIFFGEWRLQIGIAFVPSIPLLWSCYFITESPRWLAKKGNYCGAYQALVELRQTHLQAARDIFMIHEHLELERDLSWAERHKRTAPNNSGTLRRTSYTAGAVTIRKGLRKFFARVPRLFSIRRNLRAVLASSIVMIAQQLSGINVFAFLATTLFDESGIGEHSNLWFNAGFAAANALFSGLTFFLIENWGRRTLLMTSLILLLPFLMLAGHFLDSLQLGSIISIVIIYAALYSPGAGVIPFMYAAEVFPQDFKEVGMSFACCVNFAFAGGLAMAVPYFMATHNLPYTKLLGAFAGLDALAIILVFFFMRSPDRSMSLGAMNFLFGAAFKDFVGYQFRVATPYAIRRLFNFLVNVCLCRTGHNLKAKYTFLQWEKDRMEAQDQEMENESSGDEEAIEMSSQTYRGRDQEL